MQIQIKKLQAANSAMHHSTSHLFMWHFIMFVLTYLTLLMVYLFFNLRPKHL